MTAAVVNEAHGSGPVNALFQMGFEVTVSGGAEIVPYREAEQFEHKLTQPGEFLISSPEHGTPERNRAYLMDDESRDQHAARYGHRQPVLPAPVPDAPSTAPEPPQDAPDAPPRGDDNQDDRIRPETALWDALVDAGPEGVSIGELAAACRRTTRWVYYRLQEHAQAGRAAQVRRGYWRAARPADGPPAAPLDSDGL